MGIFNHRMQWILVTTTILLHGVSPATKGGFVEGRQTDLLSQKLFLNIS